MEVQAKVLNKWARGNMTDVEVEYTCPYCKELVIEPMCFSGEATNHIAVVEDHRCYECGEDIELAVDFY